MCELEELREKAKAKGTDRQYRHWVSFQPSCISGRYSEWVDGYGRNEAAHVRRINTGSGTGKKGEYACVPLLRSEHALQHQHGETYLASKAWWNEQVIKYLKKWIESK